MLDLGSAIRAVDAMLRHPKPALGIKHGQIPHKALLKIVGPGIQAGRCCYMRGGEPLLA